MELSGKVAFITGAATGLGKGFAEALLQKRTKAIFVDIDESTGNATLSEFQERFGSKNVRFMKLDVTNEDQFEKVFNGALTEFGQIDIMVNNAGILDEENWQRCMDINIVYITKRGVIKGTKLAEEHMRKDKGGHGGRIINVSSMAGLIDSFWFPVYCATKHAIRSFTISQAGQFDILAKGVEYGVLCPYTVETDRLHHRKPRSVHHFKHIEPLLKYAIPPALVTTAFVDLVQQNKMNGAILKVTEDGHFYQMLELVDLGPMFSSALQL